MSTLVHATHQIIVALLADSVYVGKVGDIQECSLSPSVASWGQTPCGSKGTVFLKSSMQTCSEPSGVLHACSFLHHALSNTSTLSAWGSTRPFIPILPHTNSVCACMHYIYPCCQTPRCCVWYVKSHRKPCSAHFEALDCMTCMPSDNVTWLK